MDRPEPNGINSSNRNGEIYRNGGGLYNPYGVGRGGMNINQQSIYQQGRWPHDYEDAEDDEEKEEMQRLMINLRKIVIPQLEQVLAYILIPMVGSWIFKLFKTRAPTLPTVVNISFSRTSKLPIDYWQNPFVKT